MNSSEGIKSQGIKSQGIISQGIISQGIISQGIINNNQVRLDGVLLNILSKTPIPVVPQSSRYKLPHKNSKRKLLK